MIVPAFKGIHNTVPIRSIPDDALSDAVNVDLTDSGAVVRRAGFTLAQSMAIESWYQMDNGRCFITAGGVLYEIDESLGQREIGGSTATSFDDYGDVLFTNDGLMLNGQVLHDLKTMLQPTTYPVASEGSPTELPMGVNADPLERFADPFPAHVDHVCWYDSSLYCSQQLDNETVIWYSKPHHYHLYDYAANYILVPGQLLAMARTPDMLCLGTSTAIYAYNGALAKVADYGVIPGRPIARRSSGQILIYTERGVCTFPFQNLTEAKVSLPPGRQCATSVIDQGGISRFIAVHDGGGEAHNRAY